MYILGFNLPELEHKRDFISRIVRADYDDGKHFLADKYSDYYIELDKCPNWKKPELPEQFHELWDLCMILKTKIKDQDEVIKMEAIQSPLALDLARETRIALAPDEFVNDTIRRERGLAEIQTFLERQRKNATHCAEMAAMKKMEEMVILALQNNATPYLIEIMRTSAGIADSRLAELKMLAKVD